MSLNARLDAMTDHTFRRLAALLADIQPRANVPPINLSVGEPTHQPPPFVSEILARPRSDWNIYPMYFGTPELRRACAAWATRRYRLPATAIDPDQMIVPVSGTREGLYFAATLAVTPAANGQRPLALMPNPFYQVYYGAAVMAGAEPAFLPATKATGFLPDFDAVDPAVLDRAQVVYLCSPANPQGAVASLDYLKRLLTLARKHDFLLVMDECYSELYYTKEPAPGGLDAAKALGGSLDNLLVFHSLSKRSSAPGLRSGFATGAPKTIALMNRLRSYSAAAQPLAIMEASAACWKDEEHVEKMRAHYRALYDIAERVLKGRFGFYRPDGGFYLWLDVGDGEAACKRLWGEAAVRVLPGSYMTRANPDGSNDGAPYIRVALVGDRESTEEALTRMARVL
ncbi:MAG: aminotransferase class I/II-fold pyridoxal phosphate-dependent enzyme [Alphaproteobacteria bacterium]|nr:aminotransferase class I/II-fold pyridoxal phosphate-dependent enzyme [Alphaproteobacteria bacterium]